MGNLNDRFRLDGSTAVVTGASFGLGYGIAEGLAESGANIVAVSRRAENLKDVQAVVASYGRECLPVVCDVSDQDQVDAMVAQALERFGRIDILVNNAGIIKRSPAVDFTEADWKSVIDVNLNGVWYCCQAAGRAMVSQKRGKIINIGSVLSFQGGILVPSYAAAKGALGQLTQALANEWASEGVNVNGIAPGYCVTANTEALRADAGRSEAILARIPAGRWGTPDDLKGAAVFLASEASDYIHGHMLVVDGGWLGR
ncbi:MAG: 2-dehydro-3-deoxy-D-gluconate 5-dehydrogenase KduD [Candidatus Latescibacteria bacterium]|jgi:2-dehydro-3-deoxy-D-gluconate 5-dehydrogenase|nr:2-dehydro-3-deoxy-D-gluconate 5-dehydrogenase KduD [Candidatus Latescibacterota bacterium]